MVLQIGNRGLLFGLQTGSHVSVTNYLETNYLELEWIILAVEKDERLSAAVRTSGSKALEHTPTATIAVLKT